MTLHQKNEKSMMFKDQADGATDTCFDWYMHA
jgi:hypothetical protein